MSRVRLVLAWVLLIGSLVGWPVSAVTFARNEPPFILSLSWLAIVVTAIDVLSTQGVRANQEDDAKVAPLPRRDNRNGLPWDDEE